jgi:hypothetical protein
MFWFEKSKENLNNGLEGFELQNLGVIKKGFVDFKFTIQAAINQAMELKEKCYGFGGAQMLPILAYHMNSNLEFMDAILDDNIDRNKMKLPGILPEIRLPLEGEMENAAIMITALDSTRPILQRLSIANPRRIMHPMQCY